MKEKIFLVYKTHFDLGFTDLSEKVMNQYSSTMLKDVIKTCNDTTHLGERKFVWTMSAWALYDMLERTEGQLHKDLEKMVAENRITWHALPFTSHTDFSSIEEMVAGLRYGKELSERFSIPMKRTAKMTDVPGHGKILPTILKKAGIDFLHLGSNEFAASPDVPLIFWWEGPDGSKVLTMYVSDGYGSSMLPPDDWQYPVWMAFMHTHDNIGPQTPEMIEEIVADIKKQRPNAEVLTGTMEDFYSEIQKSDLSDLPVISKDLADSWIHGIGTYPKQVREARQTRNDLVMYEMLSALSDKPENFEKYRDEIYDNLSIFSEHTWGLDVKTWLRPRVYDKKEFLEAKETQQYKYMEQSWQEQTERVDTAVELLSDAFKEAEDKDVASIANPNTWEHTGWVRAGEHIDDTVMVFSEPMVYAEKVNPVSTDSLSKISKLNNAQLKVTQDDDCVFVENHRYKIIFSDKSGEISEVIDKSLGEPILKSREHPVFSYLYGKYGDQRIEQYLDDYGKKYIDWGVADNGREDYPSTETEYFSPDFLDWKVEEHNLIFRWKGKETEKYGDTNEINIVVTLPPAGEELFLEVILKGKQATPMVESTSIILPLPWDKPEYVVNKNGFELNPATDIAKNANHAFYCLESYAKAESDRVGVCIVSHDTPLMSIGETGVYTFRGEYEEHEPEIYFNLSNNMWGTNFPQWIEGDFSFRYTIFGYKKGEKVESKAFSNWSLPKIVKAKENICPIDIPEGFRLLTYRPSSEKGYILELLDIAEIDREVSLSADGYKLQKVDLYERPLSAIFENTIKIAVSKNDIVTVSLFK